MTYATGSTPSATPLKPAPDPRKINGRELARHRNIRADHRALLAADLTRGRLGVFNLTRQQALAVTRASSGYLATATQLTPEQRAKVEYGRVSLSELHNHHEPSNATIERIVRAAPDRVLAALDKLTRPALVAAE